MEIYTSDYKLNSLEKEKLFHEIDRLVECKDTLCDLIGDTEELKSVFNKITEKVKTHKSQLEQKYPDGVYRLRRDYALIKQDTLIKREKGDSCEDCIFNKMPCLGPRYDYGCYTTNEHSPNANPAYGELVRTGHFVEYKERK